MWETQASFQLSFWPISTCCGHLGGEIWGYHSYIKCPEKSEDETSDKFVLPNNVSITLPFE